MNDREILLNQRNRVLRGEAVEEPQMRDFGVEAVRIAQLVQTQVGAFKAVGFSHEEAVYFTEKILPNLI